MKKSLSIVLILILMASAFYGCSKAKDAAAPTANESEPSYDSGVPDADVTMSASDFFGAYMDAKTNVQSKIIEGLSSNPDTAISALSFLGSTLSDFYMLPAMYFGLGEANISAALAMAGAQDVTYQENGNSNTITYVDANGQEVSLTGVYDPGRSLICTGSTAGAENVFSETYLTAYGYAAQFYYLADDGTATLYLFAFSGEDGIVGIVSGADRPAPLKGTEPADFPKTAKEWYALNGSTITGVNANGESIELEYVPSADE